MKCQLAHACVNLHLLKALDTIKYGRWKSKKSIGATPGTKYSMGFL